jgi:hypothetical protein
VTILKEEKNLLEDKLYQITQQFEESRRRVDDLTRQNLFLQNHQQKQVPIPIHHTIDHRSELEQVKNCLHSTTVYHSLLVEF